MAFLLPRSAFIHIPKTGGQWVAKAIEDAGVPIRRLGVVHTSPDELEHAPEFQACPVVFAIVRDPLSWYPSIFAHRTDEAWTPIDDEDWFTQPWIDIWSDFTEHCRADTFPEFVERCATRYPDGFLSMLYERYTDGCTHVGRYEQLAADLEAILTEAGEDFDPPRLARTAPTNVRAQEPYRRERFAYSLRLRELVLRTEERAVLKFGYQPSAVR